jgi:hypothetical protein
MAAALSIMLGRSPSRQAFRWKAAPFPPARGLAAGQRPPGDLTRILH